MLGHERLDEERAALRVEAGPDGISDRGPVYTGRRVALVSQSGAFLITRLSNVGCLDPAYAVSVGNQIDLTISDLLDFLAHAGERGLMPAATARPAPLPVGSRIT